jgi:hypothetical protein
MRVLKLVSPLLVARRYELVVRTLSDELPEQADIAYLFGEATDNQQSVLKKGAELWKERRVRQICILGLKSSPGYEGFDPWRDALIGLGVQATSILPINPQTVRGASNTLTEAIDLVAVSQRCGWRSVVVVGAPFHLLRCFMSTVGQVQKQHTNLQVYAACGGSLPWTARVTHSQGVVVGTRAQLISGDIAATVIYHWKGDLPSVKQALNYLDSRG